MKIVYIATHGLGDLVMSMPAIRALERGAFRLSFVLKGDVERQFLDVAQVSSQKVFLVSEYRRRGKLWGFLSLVRDLRRGRYQAAVSQVGVHALLFWMLCFLAGIPVRIASPAGRSGSSAAVGEAVSNRGEHKVLRNYFIVAAFFRQIGRRVPDNLPSDLGASDAAGAVSPGVTVVMAPGSGSVEAHKRWGQEQFAELARRLVAHAPRGIGVIGGPDEADLCARIREVSGGACVAIVVDTVRAAYEHLKAADVVVANCNGLAHLAAYASTPVVGLYGPTDWRLTGPYTRNLTVVSNQLECSPCYGPGYVRGCGNPVCMAELSVDKVEAAVVKTLAAVLKRDISSGPRQSHA